MRYSKVLATFVAIFVFISSIIDLTESVECYKCDSKSDGQRCLDPFDPTGIRIRTCANCIVILTFLFIVNFELFKKNS